jgi:hypothetical protein
MSQKDLNKIHAKSKDLAKTDVRELYFVSSSSAHPSLLHHPARTDCRASCVIPNPQQLTENARTTDKWDSTPSTIPKPIPKANRRDRGRKFEEDFQDSNKKDLDDWEIKRVERPEGLAEWGEAPMSPEEKKRERERKLV